MIEPQLAFLSAFFTWQHWGQKVQLDQRAGYTHVSAHRWVVDRTTRPVSWWYFQFLHVVGVNERSTSYAGLLQVESHLPQEPTQSRNTSIFILVKWRRRNAHEPTVHKHRCATKITKKCNLTLKWAHLPMSYTIIGVTCKWLAIACKCTIQYVMLAPI